MARAHASAEVTDRVEHLESGEPQVGIESYERYQYQVVGHRGGEHRTCIAAQMHERGDLQARTSRGSAEALDQASGQGGNGAAVDSIHQPLGYNQPVSDGDQQRSADPGNLRYPLEGSICRTHASPPSHARASRAPRSAMSPSRAIGSEGSRIVRSTVFSVGGTKNRFPSGDSTAMACQAPRPRSFAVRAASRETPASSAATRSPTSSLLGPIRFPLSRRPFPSTSSCTRSALPEGSAGDDWDVTAVSGCDPPCG